MAKNGSLRRRAVGVGALGLIGVGLWLGSKFGGFGLGDGIGLGKGPGSGEATGERGDASRRPATVDLTGLSRPAVESPPRPERLRVVIDGGRLLIADSSEGASGEPADATEIAQRVKQTTGDDQGIRIRIERTKRATSGALSDLRHALEAAGITREEIQEATGYLD